LIEKKKDEKDFVLSAVTKGNNSDLIENALSLYSLDDKDVADITYGPGVFWKKIDRNKLKSFRAFDILPKHDFVEKADCRKLPLEDNSLDAVFFDPPYRPWSTKISAIDKTYNNLATTEKFSVKDLSDLYLETIKEAERVLRPKGLLFFKIQDCVSSGKQHRQSITVFNHALNSGFIEQDQFLLVNKRVMIDAKWEEQHHSRKNFSILWVFKKKKTRRIKT